MWARCMMIVHEAASHRIDASGSFLLTINRMQNDRTLRCGLKWHQFHVLYNNEQSVQHDALRRKSTANAWRRQVEFPLGNRREITTERPDFVRQLEPCAHRIYRSDWFTKCSSVHSTSKLVLKDLHSNHNMPW
mmetsp:Transcript_18121/g.45440  ORF Transcript_18121/g.45440 Transcript_18121/m.45440 type:complete len:133 (+) Transcript_18121:189-587(+)